MIRELMKGPLRPSELEECLPHAPHSALMRRLTEMRSGGIVSHERHTGLPPRVQYELTKQGRLILEILEVAEDWERRWAHRCNGGSSALGLIADERNRELVFVLASGPASPKVLEACLPGSPRTLQRRLARRRRGHHRSSLQAGEGDI